MLWSVNIGSIAGTAVRIHITFIMFLVWIFAAGWASGGPEAAMASLIFMVLLFVCVLAHDSATSSPPAHSAWRRRT